MKHDIPACNFYGLKHQIDRLNRRAPRLGCEPISLNVLRTYNKEKTDPITRLSYTQSRMEIEIIGESPQLEGWRLLAVVETLANGENLVRCVPGCTVPESYRNTDMHCDHCGTNRRRREVFILRHEDGRTVQVGRTCIADFLGHVTASTLASRAEYLMSIEAAAKEAESDYYHGGGVIHRDISSFLGTVAICIRRLGWLSRGKSEEGFATADIAWAILTDFRSKYITELVEKNNIVAEERDVELAKNALEWARKLDGGSDYLYNLGVACRQEHVNWRTTGIVASAIAAYQHTCEKQEKIKKERKSLSHVGEIGKRMDFEATVKRLRYFDSDWGVRTMCLFEDAEGNHLVWWASRDLSEIEEGDYVKIKATVKEHGEYNGTPQTVVQRCKILS